MDSNNDALKELHDMLRDINDSIQWCIDCNETIFGDTPVTDLLKNKIDLQADLIKTDLGLQDPQPVLTKLQDKAAAIEKMKNAGFEYVDGFTNDVWLFQDQRTGQQLPGFAGKEMVDQFLENRKVIATILYHQPSQFHEEIQYYIGQEEAALSAYKDALYSMGVNSVSYRIESMPETDRLAYQFEKAAVGELGLDPELSEAEFVSQRILKRAGLVSDPVVTLIYYKDTDNEQREHYFLDETAKALDHFRQGLDSLGVNNISFSLSDGYEHLQQQFDDILCECGFDPIDLESLSEQSYEESDITLDHGEIAAFNYSDNDGNIVTLRFNEGQEIQAAATFEDICQGGNIGKFIVSPSAPELDYQFYTTFGKSVDADCMSKSEFMERYHPEQKKSMTERLAAATQQTAAQPERSNKHEHMR